MDLAVATALLTKEDLPGLAGCDLSLLLDAKQIAVAEYHAPKTIASQASVLRQGRGWVVSISGGIDVNSWAVLEKSEVHPAGDDKAQCGQTTRGGGGIEKGARQEYHRQEMRQKMKVSCPSSCPCFLLIPPAAIRSAIHASHSALGTPYGRNFSACPCASLKNIAVCGVRRLAAGLSIKLLESAALIWNSTRSSRSLSAWRSSQRLTVMYESHHTSV
jgi:hypothetical protein